MQILGLAWLGTRTERFDETVRFASTVLGLTLSEDEPGMAVFALPDGSTFEVFDQDHPGGGHPQGVVAGFRVEDPAAAREELAAAGCEVSDLHSGESMRWAYFRAPDGNLYELLG